MLAQNPSNHVKCRLLLSAAVTAIVLSALPCEAMEHDLTRGSLSAAAPRTYAPVTREELTPDIINPEAIDSFLAESLNYRSWPENEVARLSLQLIRPSMSADNVRDIIFSFATRVDYRNRVTFATFVQQFITPNMSGREQTNIIQSMSTLSSDNYAAFNDSVAQFITPDMRPDTRAEVTDVLLRAYASNSYDVDCATQFISFVHSVTLDMSINERAKVITALFRVNKSNRAEFVKLLQQFITPDMDSHDKWQLFMALSFRINDRTNAFANLVTQLITPNMNGRDRAEIMYAVGMGSDAIRNPAEFISCVKQFITPTMNGRNQAEMIKTLSKLKLKDRATFKDFAKQLIVPDMYRERIMGRDRPDMWDNSHVQAAEILSRVNISERANFVARALLFMRANPYNYMMQTRQIFETPLNQEIMFGGMNAVAQGVNPYEAGFNAHADGRDERVVAAAHSLYATWYPTPAELDATYVDFLRAVRALDGTRQARVLRSLGIDRNGNVLPKPAHETFSGLVSGVDESGKFVLSGNNESMRVNGREIVARFWHFANTYDEHEYTAASSLSRAPSSETIRDRQNMREGIIDALVRGVNEHNTLRCEPGRVQLLGLATVQGRLSGADGRVVDIDNLGLNPEVAVVAAGAAVEAAAVVPAAQVAVPAQGAQAEPALITNLDEIAHHLQPFVNSLGAHITTANQFYMELFRYINRLADGGVMARGERIRLDPASVVYFVRMMEPAVVSGGRVRVPARINPHASLVALFGFGDAFRIDDYERQFGARDRAQFEAAQAAARARIELEQRRALVAQQDREYAADVAEDLVRGQQNRAATNIQRIARGKLARNDVEVMRTQAAKQARAKAELDQRVIALRAAITAGTAGAIGAPAEVVNTLTSAERVLYLRQQNEHRLTRERQGG